MSCSGAAGDSGSSGASGDIGWLYSWAWESVSSCFDSIGVTASDLSGAISSSSS